MQEPLLEELRTLIRDVRDFPKPGITFKDITPLLGDARAFRRTIDAMVEQVKTRHVTKVVAIESRGFLLGSAIALELGAGLAIARKPNKLPFSTTKIEYGLEYGIDTLEMHVDSLKNTDSVLIVDDVLATGGTALATAQLVQRLGAQVTGLAFLLELTFLQGRKKLEGHAAFSLFQFH